jgi:hypothetical protein
MGGSHSSTATNITNNTVNQTDISNTTKNIQESATNTLVENASSCASSVEQTNSCNLSGATIAGNFNLDGTQSNKASVNFSCVQSSSAANSMTDAMASSIANEMGVLNGTEAAAKINAAAEAATKSGFLSLGGGSSKSDVNTNVNYNVTNSTKAVVENIFKKNLSNNFSSKTVDECIGRTKQSNSIEAVGVKVGGNANVECNQSNSLEQVSECKQMTEAINKTLSQTAQELGFKVSNKSDTSAKSEVTATAKTKTESEGVASAINAFANVINALNPFSSLFGSGETVMAASCCCCFLICCILIVSMVVMKSGGGDASGVPGGFNLPRGMPKMGRRFRGGYSDSENTSDIVEYLGAAGIDLVSDIISDSSPLFE